MYGYSPMDEFNIDDYFDGIGSDPIEAIKPSMEQCSICARKFDLPKDLNGPQKLIPIHTELFSSRCGGSGKEPRSW